jgi:hypothetical protein
MTLSIDRRRMLPVALAAAALMLAAPFAAAETYHVQLLDGGTFQSRYQPVEASWDTDQILLLTEYGNWIAVAKADVQEITTETENKGYGRVIDTTTISLGLKVNDMPVPRDPSTMSDTERLINFLQDQDYGSGGGADYTVDQFVEPGVAGQGGIPATGLITSPGGSVGSAPGGFFPVGGGGGGVAPVPTTVEPSGAQ